MRVFATLLGLLLAVAAAQPACAQREEILSFESRIEIAADSDLTVTESITVRATGRKIKRGIYRDFPTIYHWPDGRRHSVGFEVLDVLRDGRPEPWFRKPQGDMQRVYIGDKNVLLQPGVYTYTILYRTTRQVGFFDGHDELYWNVTGNGWAFPIRDVRATVILPNGASVTRHEAYTGLPGARGRDWRADPDGAGGIIFETSRVLSPREGLTIVVAWPKGYVAMPKATRELGWWASDNLHWIIALSGVAFVLHYFLVTWFRAGRDPKMGTIVPLFEPPPKVSPAVARYVMRLRYDDKALTASVVNLAVHGFLKIGRSWDGYYRLSQNKDRAGDMPASRGERAFLECIFQEVGAVLLKKGESQWPRLAQQEHESAVTEDCEDVYHTRHDRKYVVGLFASLLAFSAFVYGAVQEPGVRALIVTAGAGVLLIVINILFRRLLATPTALGQQTREQLCGFRMYLATAEQERLDALHPPERTPALFEKYLPYAIALDVENEWSEQFRDVLTAATVGPWAAEAYEPDWYDRDTDTDGGSSGDSFGIDFSKSFEDSFAEAAAPPGSSSGFSSDSSDGFSGSDYSGGGFSGGGSSRGGSSGGGGGGGGGGGW